MRNIVLLFCLLLFISSVFSEENKSINNTKLEFFTAYGSYLDLNNNEDLNNFLLDNEFYLIQGSIRPTYISFGFTLNYNPFLTEISFYNNNTNMFADKNNSSIRSYGLNLDVFYNITKDKKWTLSPMIGIHINNYNLIAVSKNKISNLSGNSLEEVYQKNGILALNIGVDIKRKIVIHKFKCNVGINSSYKIDLGNKYWQNSSQSNLLNIPSTNMSGLSILFKIGFPLI